MSGSAPPTEIIDLQLNADRRARTRGHRLGPWEDRNDDSALAARAVCKTCGRVAYIRFEAGLSGAAGAALTEGCIT